MTVVNPVGSSAAYAAATESNANKKKDDISSISVFDAGEANNTIDIDNVCTDGDDNGGLSAKEITKLAVKGAGEDATKALTSPLGIAGMIQPTTSAMLHNVSTLIIGVNSMKELVDRT